MSLVNLFYELGMLAHTPRSGFAFLGSGQQSVAEHSYRMTLIGYFLAKKMDVEVDTHKLLMISLLHDLPESRTGDLNHVNKKYVSVHLPKVLKEIEEDTIYGEEIVSYIQEYEEGSTIESKIAHDADQLELILALRREYENGNTQAEIWMDIVQTRIRLQEAKELAQEIRETPSHSWWLDH